MKVSFLKRISRKQMSFLIFLSCTLLLCFALYLEIAEGLDPCPLCSLQRACMALGGGSRLSPRYIILENRLLGYVVVQILFFDWLSLQAGKFIYKAYRQIWFPLVAQIWISSEYSFFEVLRMIIFDDGSCAEVMWKFLGFSIPQWTILSFFPHSNVSATDQQQIGKRELVNLIGYRKMIG